MQVVVMDGINPEIKYLVEKIFSEIQKIQEERSKKIRLVAQVLRYIVASGFRGAVCTANRQDEPGQVPFRYCVGDTIWMEQGDDEWYIVGFDEVAEEFLIDHDWDVIKTLGWILYQLQTEPR